MKIKKSIIISNALDHLRVARIDLRFCHADKAADYVARAMKSTEGALRNAKRFEFKHENNTNTKETAKPAAI